jgi:putative Mg2+ transporter-C (MgtC) family protein
MLNDLGLEPERLAWDAVRVLIAFLLAFPIAWERGHGTNSPGFRTLPIVAMAACGMTLLISTSAPGNSDALSRVVQGIITGVGFIGGGAILKQGGNVRGLATAASVWNAGAIGVAVGLGRTNIAVVLSAINFLSLLLLSRSGVLGSHPAGPEDDSG